VPVTTPSPRELRRDVLSVAGIADAEVDGREGTPRVRVWLDGSRDADEVAAEIRKVLAGVTRTEERTVVPERATSARRGGLGRGLDSLIPPPIEKGTAAHLRPLRDADDPIQLDVVAVVERADGVVVRAEDTAGRSAEVSAGERDVDRAVSAAVAAVVGLDAPRGLAVESHVVDGERVVTVIVDLSDGSRRVGSAIARAGRPFTVGSAVWAALHHGGGPT